MVAVLVVSLICCGLFNFVSDLSGGTARHGMNMMSRAWLFGRSTRPRCMSHCITREGEAAALGGRGETLRPADAELTMAAFRQREKRPKVTVSERHANLCLAAFDDAQSQS